MSDVHDPVQRARYYLDALNLNTKDRRAVNEATDGLFRHITHLEAQLEKVRGLAEGWKASAKAAHDVCAFKSHDTFNHCANQLTAILQPARDEAGSA